MSFKSFFAHSLIAVLLFASSFVLKAHSDYYVDVDSTNGTLANSTTGWGTPLGAYFLDSLKITTLLPGDKVFIRGKGTYTIADTINFSGEDGTTAAPIAFFFVKPTCTDTGVDIDSADYQYDTTGWWCDFGGFTVTGGDNYKLWYGKFKSSCGAATAAASPWVCPQGGDLRECTWENDTTVTTTSKYALSATNCITKKCNLKSLKTRCMTASLGTVEDCNFLGDRTAANSVGIFMNASAPTVNRCKFVNLNRAISIAANDIVVEHCVAYLCSTFLYTDAGQRIKVLNNVMEKMYKYGMYSSAVYNTSVYIGNHFGDSCGVNWTNIDTTGNYKDFRVTRGSTKWKDPINFDFSTDSLNAPWLKKGY